MSILVEKELICSFSAFRVVLLIIFIKTPINQPEVVQIQKFWCLHPSTFTCLSCENSWSIKNCHRKLLSREGTLKTFKIRPQITIENVHKWNNSKRSHSKKFCLSVGELVVHLMEKFVEKVRVQFFFHWNPL